MNYILSDTGPEKFIIIYCTSPFEIYYQEPLLFKIKIVGLTSTFNFERKTIDLLFNLDSSKCAVFSQVPKFRTTLKSESVVRGGPALPLRN